MRRVYIQKQGKHIWGLDKWYEKTIFVLATAWLVVVVLAFIVGFIVGLVEESSGEVDSSSVNQYIYE